MKRALLVILILLFMGIGSAHGSTTLWQAWMYVSDDKTISVAWDAVEGATYYEVQMIAMYPDQVWTKTVQAPALTASFVKVRTGLHRFLVRACNGIDPCSDWTRSDGPNGQVIKPDGQAVTQPWMVFFRPSPVIIK